MSSPYEPGDYSPTVTLTDGGREGVTIYDLDYGPADARRQADALAALESITFGRTAIVLVVRCARTHRLAEVYRTPAGPMITVYQDDRADADLRRLRHQLGVRVEYAEKIVTDVLDGPDDFDLEAKCRCGHYRLDRHAITGAVAAGHDTLIV